MSSGTPRTSVEYMRDVSPPQQVAVVRCSCEPTGCCMRFTSSVRADEAAARRRTLGDALAGMWVRRGPCVWCPTCARKLLVST